MSLAELWQVSLALCLFSLLIVFTLIVARLFSERRAERLARERSILIPLLLGEDGASLPLVGGSTRQMLADLSSEFIHLVRGEERARFVEAASRQGVDRVLIRRLRKGNARDRAAAAQSLVAFPGDEVTRALDAALSDRERSVRFAAAMALAESGRAPPVRALIDRLDLGGDENSLLIADLFQLIATHDADSIEALLPPPYISTVVKLAAIRALMSLRGFALAPIVTDLVLSLDEGSPQLPQFIRALGQFQHPAAIPAIRRYLDAERPYVRAAAAQAAGQIGMRDAAPSLAAMMHDEDWWVRFRAGEALVRLGKRGVGQLREWACMGAEPAKSAARLTLSENGIAL